MPHAPLLVVPAAQAYAWEREHRPSHVVTIASPPDDVRPVRHAEERRRRVSKHAPDPYCVLRDGASRLLSMTNRMDSDEGSVRLALAFHDIDDQRPGLVQPGEDDVAAILRFADTWDGARPLLIYCTLGISRSPAAAYAIACARTAAGREAELAARLRAASPCATPNRLIVALADRALGREGRMDAAIAALGRGADYEPQPGFALRLP